MVGWYENIKPFESLIGKTLANVDIYDNERIVFSVSDGTAYNSYHMQDCCESVTVHDTRGDISDVIGSPIVEAEEWSNSDNKPSDYADSWTWTYQRLKTEKGEVTFVWLGESNGYYGETPYFGITHGEEL